MKKSSWTFPPSLTEKHYKEKARQTIDVVIRSILKQVKEEKEKKDAMS